MPASGRVTYYDSSTPGLELRVSSTGVKSFAVRRKIDGRAIRVTLGRYPAITLDQAQRQSQIATGEMAQGIDPNKRKKAKRARGITLEQCFEDYLLEKGRNLAESTKSGYRASLKNHAADWYKSELSSINRDMIAKRHRKIASGGRGQKGQPIAANNLMRLIRALFNFAHASYEDEEGSPLFVDNPVLRLSANNAWSPERRRTRILKRGELPGWFDAVEKLRGGGLDAVGAVAADYLEFVLFTGLRRDDALCLRWDQVDMDEGVMSPVIHKKKREVMDFPLSELVMEILRRREEARVNEFVFPGRYGKGRMDDPKKQIEKVIESSGIEFSSHDLRRTFITVADSLNLSTYVTKRLCSHSLGNDVTAGYIIMDVERLRKPLEQIADFFLVAAKKKREEVEKVASVKMRRAESGS